MTKVAPILEFPLTEITALKLVRNIAANHSNKVQLSRHTRKERMPERGISLKQVLDALSSKSNWITEGPYQEPGGDWRCTIQGVASGDTLGIVIRFKRLESDPNILVITVFWIN
jgi:hypothetical protein